MDIDSEGRCRTDIYVRYVSHLFGEIPYKNSPITRTAIYSVTNLGELIGHLQRDLNQSPDVFVARRSKLGDIVLLDRFRPDIALAFINGDISPAELNAELDSVGVSIREN